MKQPKQPQENKVTPQPRFDLMSWVKAEKYKECVKKVAVTMPIAVKNPGSSGWNIKFELKKITEIVGNEGLKSIFKMNELSQELKNRNWKPDDYCGKSRVEFNSSGDWRKLFIITN